MKHVIGILCLLLGFAAPVQADELNDAVKDYNQRSYGPALQKLQTYCAKNPNNDLAHYYLGLCNQSLHRRQQARSEYAWVATHSRNAALVNNARAGLQSTGSGSAGASSGGGAVSAPSVSASSFFFTQVNDPKWNRKAAQRTLNCGPTCLAMVFKRFDKYPDSFKAKDPEYLIQATRVLMTGGNTDAETDCRQVANGAISGGLKANRVDGLDEVDAGLDRGNLVIAVGNPFQDGSYGRRVGYEEFDNGHFILITGKSGGYYVVNDPYYVQGPINLSSGELKGFLNFYEGKYTGNCISIGL